MRQRTHRITRRLNPQRRFTLALRASLLESDRLDEREIVVLDVADARTHRPADDVLGRVGASSGFCGVSAGFSPSHSGHASGFNATLADKAALREAGGVVSV
jgi:hypothetical protein